VQTAIDTYKMHLVECYVYKCVLPSSSRLDVKKSSGLDHRCTCVYLVTSGSEPAVNVIQILVLMLFSY